MPRSATAGELTVLASAAFAVFTRLLIKDTEGTWKDLSTLGGGDWLFGYDVDQDIDQPIGSATFTIRRDTNASTVQSLSPLRVDSVLNRKADTVTFQSIVDCGRFVRFELATVAAGTTPASGDWQRLFEGSIDSVDLDHEPMTVHCRDLGAELVDRWTYGKVAIDHTASPVPIEDVIQDILDAEFTPDTAPTIWMPTSPSFDIKTFGYDIESLNEVLQRLISIIGWDLRYMWDDGTSSFRLKFFAPDRAKVIPDATIGTNQYIDVERFAIDRTLVRNAITVLAGSGTSAVAGIAEDPTSIAKYGRRPVTIQEGAGSPIDTNVEAQDMADLILADLKDPKADQSITMLPYWPVELHDLLRFTANDVHYDTDQDLAVVHIRHKGTVNDDGTAEHRTIIDTRGSPAVRTQVWIEKGIILPIERIPQGSQALHLGVRPDGSVDVALNGTEDTQSWRYATSTSAMPSDATAEAGTVVSGRQAVVNVAAALTLGQTIYVKAVPFAYTGGNGPPGPTVGATQTRQNKATSKTLRIPAHELVPSSETVPYFLVAYLEAADTTERVFYGPIVLPKGVTITGVSARMNRGAVGCIAVTKVHRVDDATMTTLATLTHDTTGWQTKSASFSEAVGDYIYIAQVNLKKATGSDAALFAWLEVAYGVPDLATGI